MTSPSVDTFPLTEIQYAYWVGRGPDFVLGNVCPHAYFELAGRQHDIQVLERAWNTLIDRHPMLRVHVDPAGNQVVSDSRPWYSIELRVGDESDTSAVRADMSEAVYDAGTWPLFDVRVSRQPSQDTIHVSLDLLAIDLAGVSQIFSEWHQLCLDQNLQLPPVTTTFGDYLRALTQVSLSPRAKDSRRYWSDRARTLSPPPALPLAMSPAAVAKPRFVHREFSLGITEWATMREECDERGLSPTTVIAAAFAAVLAAWTASTSFTLNLTLFNRLPLLTKTVNGVQQVDPDLSKTVGDFTSITLLEVANTSGSPVAVAKRIQSQLQDDLRYRDASALHALRERRRLGLDDSFSTMPVVFTSGLGTIDNLSHAFDYFGEITYRLSQTPQVWFDHQVVDFDGRLNLTWDVVEELFPPGMIDDMFAAYSKLIQNLSLDKAAWDTAPLIPLPDRQGRIRNRANATTASHTLPTRLDSAFYERLAVSPQSVAVIAGAAGAAVTYEELDAMVSELAGRLVDLHVEPGDRVAISVSRGPREIAAVLAVLKVSAAYVPVSIELPAARISSLVVASGACVHITDTSCVGTGHADRHDAELSGDGPAQHQIAYVIFTSGSTGAPKGVVMSHGAAANTCSDLVDRYDIGSDDNVLALANLNFDLSVFDMFGTQMAGATMIVPDQELRSEPSHWVDLMTAHRVTVWNSVPAQMQMLLDFIDAGFEPPSELKTVMLSGDWVPVDLPERIFEIWPHARVYVLGGATEAGIWSNHREVRRGETFARSIPYGTPLRSQSLHILDAELRNCPEWVPGDLYIGGAGLADGYLNDPTRTRASFIQHETLGRIYKTGDSGRYIPTGEVEFLGRHDGQIKINGHRVEIGEIEATFKSSVPGIENVAVVPQSAGSDLVAFVTCAHDRRDHKYHRGAEIAKLCRVENSDTLPFPPGVDELFTALNRLHVHAVGAAFATLGVPHGVPVDAETLIRNHGVADRYARWIHRGLSALVDAGFAERHNENSVVFLRQLSFTQTVEDLREQIRSGIGALGIDNHLSDWLFAIAADLPRILTDEAAASEIYTSPDTGSVYEQLFKQCYDIAQSVLAQTVTSDTETILEVGAGLGTFTPRAIEAATLHGTEPTYIFTDVSRYFLNFAPKYRNMAVRTLDINFSAPAQGLAERADVVIAVSVLHDVENIGRTLSAISDSLKPGGALILVEQTVFHPWFDLVMGIQPGFDSFKDTDVRQNNCLLNSAEWHKHLTEYGFSEITILPSNLPGFDTIVAYNSDLKTYLDSAAITAELATVLPSHMIPDDIRQLTDLPLTLNGKIDRKLLRELADTNDRSPDRIIGPSTPLQIKLLEIWKSSLKIDNFGIENSFLDFGGDSLIAAKISADISAGFDIRIPVSAVLQRPTVTGMEAYLASEVGLR